MLAPKTRCSQSALPLRAASSRHRPLSHLPPSSSRRRYESNAIRHPPPPRFAIVGSGPAAFYTASRLQRLLPACLIDMYEQLPTPYGLVRYGVAPDHPEVRHCQTKLLEVAAHKLPAPYDDLKTSAFNFVGNVKVGEDVLLGELKRHYDGLILASGASRDRTLGIKGENLSGVTSARQFVGWYNGLPEFRNWDPTPLLRASDAAIIGQGNVALDIARILFSDIDELRKTDMPEYALEVLARHEVERIHIVGRRGIFQLAATLKEVRELLELKTAAFAGMNPYEPLSEKNVVGRARTRLHHRLCLGSVVRPGQGRGTWYMKFLMRPHKFNAREEAPRGYEIMAETPPSVANLVSIDFELMDYLEDSDRYKEDGKVRGTGRYKSLPAQIAFRSIGYKAEPLPEFGAMGIEFDERSGTVRNHHGRVVSSKLDPSTQQPVPVPGVYAAGWCKKGPTGVIASTMMDAFDTAQTIAEDWMGGKKFFNGTHNQRRDSGEDLGGWTGELRESAQKRGVRYVDWQGWRALDKFERRRGEIKGKEREKIVTINEMLELAENN